MRLVLDIETNGLLDRPDLRMLCVITRNVATGEECRFRGFGHPDEAADKQRLRAYLSGVTELIGHNISGFDIFVLERLFGPDWQYTGALYDTMCVSRQRYISDIEKRTWAYRAGAGPSEEAQEARYPKRLTAKNAFHKLESWGYRLGLHKGSYLKDAGVQETWSQELEDYCARDVMVTHALWKRLQQDDKVGAPAPPYEAMLVESRFAYLLSQQEMNGVGFNRPEAEKLYAQLCGRRDELERELKAMIRPWYRPKPGKGDPMPDELAKLVKRGDASVNVPKQTYKVKYPSHLAGREKGCAFTPVVLHEFKPSSREDVANRLAALYGWKPQPDGYTDKGEISIDEDVLLSLPYPPCKMLAEYYMVTKLIGQLAEGEKSWFAFEKNGKIHGTVLPCGARTNRCSHSRPNTGQVPKVKKHPKTKAILLGGEGRYGAECRALFGPTRREWVQVGVDAAGCQLRMLAHRLAYWDGGAFGDVLLKGDPHETWRLIAGLFSREHQKTLTYAFLFGAGDHKAGTIVAEDWRDAYTAGAIDKPAPSSEAALRAAGKRAKDALRAQVPGLDQLMKACAAAHERGWVRTLDQRIVRTKTEHGTLNDVLQGDEAVLMRHAKVLLEQRFLEAGLRHGWHYGWLLDVHDEWQIECPENLAQTIGQTAARCIADAGVKLGCRVPMAGEFKIGRNWKECH